MDAMPTLSNSSSSPRVETTILGSEPSSLTVADTRLAPSARTGEGTHPLFTHEQVRELNERLASLTSKEMLSWAHTTFGDRVVQFTSFGPSGLVRKVSCPFQTLLCLFLYFFTLPFFLAFFLLS